jgi:tRNA-specific adenosine deaminase 3
MRLLGSLFNHSRTPNVSYILDRETESIRYSTTRRIRAGEELCIFYGHELWFQDREAGTAVSSVDEYDDGWGGLSYVDGIEDGEEDTHAIPNWFTGAEDEIVPEDQLPFVRLKLVDDEAEDEVETVRTGGLISTFLRVIYAEQLARTSVGG